jgi:hypothetical protein
MMPKTLIEIPDDLALALLSLPESESFGNLEDNIQAYLRKGLKMAVGVTIPVEKIDDKVMELFELIRAMPVGTEFTIKSLTEHDNLNPNTVKILGRQLSADAAESHLYEKAGKTQQNLSQYRRI